MAPRLVLRADGGPGIGFGHLARMLALGEAWVDRGGSATLMSASPPTGWEDQFRAAGIDMAAPGGGPYLVEADWVALDGYRFGRAEQEDARSRGARLLQVDDHGTVGRYTADAVLDQNLDTSPDAYRHRPPGSALLLGPRFALLRREFRRSAPLSGPVPEAARRLLVSLGGDPPPSAVPLVDVTLAHPRLEHLEVVPMTGRHDVAATMAGCDLALAAAGSTAWELCASGLPAVLVAVADNQRPVAAALAARGAAVDLGCVRSIDVGTLVTALAGLAADRAARRSMSSEGRSLVDGRGACRVVTRLRADLLQLRPATPADARLLWEWANDPVVRAAAFTHEPIPWDGHLAWLAAVLTDPAARLYVAESDRQPVGQVRFGTEGGAAEIHLSVAAGARGTGTGAAVVAAGVRRLFAETEVREVVARVRPGNLASSITFGDAGFELEGERTDGRLTWLRYARRRRADEV